MKRWFGCLLVCVLSLGVVWADEKGTPSIDAGSVIDSFRGLAPGVGWNAQFKQMTRADYAGPDVQTFRSGHSWMAHLPGEGIRGVSVVATSCATEAAAEACLTWAIERATAPLRGAPDLPRRVHTKTKGAGPGSKLPGLYLDYSWTLDGQTVHFVTHLLRYKTIVIQIGTVGLPEYDRKMQDAFIAYAIERLETPGTERPPPKAPALKRDLKLVTVRIQNSFGEPLPQAEVALSGPGMGNTVRGVCINGFCEIHFSKVEALVSVTGARGPDDDLLHLARGTATLAADATEITIRLWAGLTIAGRLRDADGKPVHGVAIAASDLSALSRAFVGDDAHEGTTDAQGRFEIHGLDAKQYSLSVHDGTRYLPTTESLLDVEAGTTDLELRLARPRSLRLRVTDAARNPIAGVQVSAVPAKYVALDPPGRARFETDETGRVEIRHLEPAEMYRVVLRPPAARTDLATTTEWARENPGEQTLFIDDGWSLHIQTVDANDKGVHAAVQYKLKGQMMGRYAETNEQGVLVIHHLALGKYEVTAFAPPHLDFMVEDGEEAARVIDPVDEPVKLVAYERKPLTVRVVGPSGAGISNFHVSLSKANHSFSMTAENGKALFARPKPPFKVTISSANSIGGQRLNLAPKTVTVRKADTAEIVLSLDPGVRIHGRLVDEEGAPIASVDVWVHAVRGHGMGRSARVGTDAEGRFDIPGLSPGRYRVRPDDQEGFEEGPEIEVAAGQGQPVVLRRKKK